MTTVYIKQIQTSNTVLPGQFSALLNCSADGLLLANHIILFIPNDSSSSRVNWVLRLLLHLKMLEDISTNNILIKTDSFFTKRMQVATSINTNPQIRLKLFA